MSSDSNTSDGDFATAPTQDDEERFCPSCEVSFPDGFEHCPEDGTRLVRLRPVEDPMLGRVIDDRFIIRERLGAGGMGAVYRSLQKSVGREVAIKVIESKLSRDRTAAKRFLREAKLSSALSQPNTVTVLDFGQTTDGMLFIAMELIEGRTLGKVLEAEGAFSIKRTVRIGVQLCDALEAAHGLSIIHRDLKPSNIIVLDNPSGRDLIKVLDFGLAKSLTGDSTHTTVTKSDVLLGTPSYISPEVIKGGGEDARTDLYSLGVVLYELISGELPFKATNVNTLLAMHAYDAPPILEGVHPTIAAVIYKLMEKEPAHRYASAADARDAMTTALDAAKHAGAVEDTAKRGRKTKSVQAVRRAALAATVATDEAPLPGGTAADTRRATPDAAASAVSAASTTATTQAPERRSWLVAALGVAVVGAGIAVAAVMGAFGSDEPTSSPAPAVDRGEVDSPAPSTLPPAQPAAVPIDAGAASAPPAATAAKKPTAAPTSSRSDSSKRSRRNRRSKKVSAKKKTPTKAATPKTTSPDPTTKTKTKTKNETKTDPEIDYRLPGTK